MIIGCLCKVVSRISIKVCLFCVPNIRWRLLITLVVTECQRHLVHVHGPIQVVQTVLAEVVLLFIIIGRVCNGWVTVGTLGAEGNVKVHFDVRVPTVLNMGIDNATIITRVQICRQ
jgi:hypothetical protein